jgi:hypothetical protein
MKYRTLRSTSKGIYPFAVAAWCFVLTASVFFHGNARAARITLTWDAENGASGYKIYYGTESDSYTTSVDVGNVTTYPLTLADGHQYYLAATAYDSGKLESNFSNEISYAAGITSCSYALSMTSVSMGASGGSGNITVTTQSGCSWVASSAASWVTISAAAGGTGSGTVAYTVGANTSVSRTASSTIAGSTFTITQSGTPSAPASTGGSVSPSDNVSDRSGRGKAFISTWGKKHHHREPDIPHHKAPPLVRPTDPDQEHKERPASSQRPTSNPHAVVYGLQGGTVKNHRDAPVGKVHFFPYEVGKKRE